MVSANQGMNDDGRKKKDWVDFQAVKAGVTMQMILDHYGVKGLSKSGGELRGPCPVHKESKKKKTFTVNLHKNAFKCFSESCGARGNILDLVAAKERCSVRDAALKLQEWFRVGESQQQSEGEDNKGSEVRVLRGIYRDGNGSLYELIANAMSAEDFEPLVVYREMFPEYQYWIAPPTAFLSNEEAKKSGGGVFTLVRELS